MSFSLKLFGGAALAGPEGPLTGPAVQRHRLALLTVLAVARPKVASRDKVMALLWPGRDSESARQLLNQAVHAVRKALGPDAIVSAGDDLQLNPAAVQCDVTGFEESLGLGNREAAVAQYSGPFLDGFFLDEAPEFERWVNRQRDRLAGACGKALEELARTAQDMGDWSGSVEWWKQRAGLDPYDSRVALSLMGALDRAGNRAGALQYGRAHQRLLQEDLEIPPDAELLAALEELKTEPRRAPARQASGAMTAAVPTPANARTTAPQHPTSGSPESMPPKAIPRQRTIQLGALLLAGVVLVGIVRLMARESPSLSQPAVDDIVQAVARELARRQQGDSSVVPPERRTSSIKAYELYLRGNDPASLRSDSGARKGLRYFQEAIALDSNYAAAWSGMARLISRTGGSREESEAAARRAVVLDETLAEAHAVIAVHRTRAGDFITAERHYLRAIELEPNRARTREWHSNHYLSTGRLAEALAEAERAVALEPLSPAASAELARALVAHNRCDEALARLEPLMTLEPYLLRVTAIAAHCYARQEKWAEAIGVLERHPPAERDPRTASMLGYVRARAGQRDEALGIQQDLVRQWRDGRLGAFWLAWVPAGLGEVDSAFAWIERSLADNSQRDQLFPMGMSDLLYEALKNDPRVDAVARRLGVQNR